jgi:hypothetical protein
MEPKPLAVMYVRGYGSRLKAGTTFPASDHRKHTFSLSPRDAPELLQDFRPEGAGDPKKGAGDPKKGAGNAGCPVHPQPRARMVVVVCARVFTARSPESPGIPARNGFTAYFVISPAIGFLAAVASRISGFVRPG